MNKPRDIYLNSLMRSVLRQWRLLLLVAVIFALLGGLYRGISLTTRLHEQNEKSESASEDTTDIASSVAEDALKQKQAYLKNSFLTQIDPQKEGQATAKLQIQFPDQSGDDTVYEFNSTDIISGTESKRKVVDVLNYYVNYIRKGIDWTDLADEMGTEPEYLQELIYVDSTDNSMGRARIRAIYKNKKGAAKIRDYVLDQISGIEHAQVSDYGEYDLQITDLYTATVVDSAMQAWLSGRLADMNALNTNLTTYQTNNPEDETEASAIGLGTVVRQTAVFAIAGFIGGIVLFILFYYLHIVASTLVLSSKEFGDRYGLRALAIIPEKDLSSLHGVDKRILQKHADDYSSLSLNTCYQIAAQNLEESAGKASKIALFGDIPADNLRSICQSLGKQIGNEFQVTALSNLNSDPASLRKLAECDAVVAVGRVEHSEYRRMDKIMETVTSYKKEIVGFIVA